MNAGELVQQLGWQIDPSKVSSEGEVSIKCWHHEDEHNSCSFNVFSGLFFCHSSGVGGDLIKAVSYITGKNEEEAREYVRFNSVRTWDPKGKDTPQSQQVEKVIDEAIAEVYARNLFQDKDRLAQARAKFGWSDETIKRFGIGFDTRTKRFIYPIRNKDGKLVNFRMYSPDTDGENKVISWTDGQGQTGYGRGRLWPEECLPKLSLILVEGEKDCVLMNQVLTDNRVDGWASVTATIGAGSWKNEWSERFKGKHVVVIYDRDQPGQEAAQKIGGEIMSFATSVRIVVLDIAEKGGDVTDYFVKHGKTWDDLKKLIDAAEYFTPQTKKEPPVGVKDTKTYKPHLSEASQEQFLFKNLEMKVMVAGKDLAPYAVPAKVSFNCYMNQGRLCAGCSNFSSQGYQEIEIERSDTEVIKMVKTDEGKQLDHVKRLRGINQKCRAVEINVSKYHNVEEVTLIPEIDFHAEKEREYVSRLGYAMEHGILPNKSYVVSGTAIPHPRTSHVVHFLHTIDDSQDNVADFRMDEVKLDRLRVFQPTNGQSIKSKFGEIARDITHNVTRIWGREDIITAVDLCFHTVVAFNFQDKSVAKAWGDMAVVGDTRTGKTETVQGMIGHYRLGEIAMGENTSFAGLIGGLRQESGGRWILTWGRLPLNDCRFLAIDESSGLAIDVISSMSGIRSNGVAEITKVTGLQRTMARTRLCWISNPRAARSMSDYSHGVEMLRELIGRPEDIARFDFAVSAASHEVPIETINAAAHEEVPHVFTSDLCHLLVLWSWSRRSDDIVFTPEATTRVLQLATQQSERYSSDGGIPLVEGGNHRIKIAKLAVAAACRTFSTVDGHKVIVTPEHAEFAAEFLDMVYEKPSLDYTGFSQAHLQRTHVSDDYQDAAMDWIKQHADWADLWRIHPTLRIDDFRNIFDLETKDVKADIIKPLSKLRMVEKTRQSEFRKTPAFISLLKDARAEGVFAENGKVTVDTQPDPDDDVPF